MDSDKALVARILDAKHVVETVDFADSRHDLIHVADGLLHIRDRLRLKAPLLEVISELLGQRNELVLLLVEVGLELLAHPAETLAQIVIDDLQLLLAAFPKRELQLGQGLVDDRRDIRRPIRRLQEVHAIDAPRNLRGKLRQGIRLKPGEERLHLLVAKAANLIRQRLGILQLAADVVELLLVRLAVQLLAEILEVRRVVEEEHIPDFVQLGDNLLLADEKRPADTRQLRRNARIQRRAVQFLKIAIVRLDEVLLDVCKVDDIAVLEVPERTVHARQRLKERMSVQLAAEVEFLEPRRVKTGQQHVVDDQEIDGLFLLVLFDRDLAFKLVAFVVEDQYRLELRISGNEQAVKLTGLCVRFADDHAGDSRGGMLETKPAHVMKDIVQKSVQIRFAFDNLLFADILTAHHDILRQAVDDFGDLLLVGGLDVLPHQLERIAVRDRLVVIVCVDVVAEHLPGRAFLPKKRRAGHSDLDRVLVRLQEVREKTSPGIISAMGLVNEEHALQTGVVRSVEDDLLVILLELLDVHHHDLGLAGRILDRSV